MRANYVCSCSLAWSETGVMETYLSHYHMEQGKFLQGMISLTFGTTNSCIISMFQEKKIRLFSNVEEIIAQLTGTFDVLAECDPIVPPAMWCCHAHMSCLVAIGTGS